MKAIGIDLGTTNSVVAVMDDVRGMPSVLSNRGGAALTPSVVSYRKRRSSAEGEVIVGDQAVGNAQNAPQNTIFSIKRLMGREYGEPRIDEVIDRFGFRLAPDPNDVEADARVKVLLNEEAYTPAEVSAMILRQLKADAELALGETVTHAVITVPAYFEERQREATREAGQLAGLEVLEVLDEPTAAALAFGIGRETERNRVLVYDLGGGTFDISLIQMTQNNSSVMEVQGNNWLGGDDFDNIIIGWIADWVKAEYGFDAAESQPFIGKVRPLAQQAKIGLSTQSEVEVVSSIFGVWEDGPLDIDLAIKREDFEAAIRPLIEETHQLVHKVLDNQSLSPEDVTAVLLVGGSTAVPMVHEVLSETFNPSAIKRDVNPMECVALGAAVQASRYTLKESATQSELDTSRGSTQHVTAMNLGIAAVENNDPDTFVPIIEKGTPYPLSEPKSRKFYASKQNMNIIRIPVYEGVESKASLNEQQGVIEIPLREGLDTSTPIEVSFNYDKNRVLTVEVKVLGTGISETRSLTRGQRRTSSSLIDDWREKLSPTMKAAKVFNEGYGVHLTDLERADLTDAIAVAEKALADGDKKAGMRVRLNLENKIMGSGVASLLFMADNVGQSLPGRFSTTVLQSAGAVRQALKVGDAVAVDRTTNELKVILAQAMQHSPKGGGGPEIADGMLSVE